MRSGDFTSDIRAFNPGGVWGILMAGRVASTNLRETSSFPANDNKILNYFILVIRRPSPRTPRSAASPRRSRRGARAACPCAPEETVLTVLWRIMAGWAACPCAPEETGRAARSPSCFSRETRGRRGSIWNPAVAIVDFQPHSSLTAPEREAGSCRTGGFLCWCRRESGREWASAEQVAPADLCDCPAGVSGD